MPIRRYSPGEGGFSAVSVLEEKDSRSLLIKGAALLGGGAIAAVVGGGLASANTDVYVGGACDPNADGVVATYQQQGRYNPGANNIQINYSASIAPVCGDESMNDSINQGAQQVVGAVNANLGDNVTVHAFSEGAAVGDVASKTIADQNGGSLPPNVHFDESGDGYGVTGIQHGIAGQIAEIVTVPMGIPTAGQVAPTPGTVENFDVNDIWGNGGSQGLNPGSLIAMAASIPNYHRVPDPREPHETFVNNGVTYNVYGVQNGDPMTQAIESQGVNVPPPLPAIDHVLDGAHDPAQDPLYNPAIVTNFLGQFAPAPDAAPVRSTTPDFFGEQPCVDQNGNQYYTPGNAPC